jgi:hypothetical protein
MTDLTLKDEERNQGVVASILKKIPSGYILPSAAYTVSRKRIRAWGSSVKEPEVGDLVYGTVHYVGNFFSLENKAGRFHNIHDGSKAVFVFGQRYAPAYHEGLIPNEFVSEMDLLSRSGIVGIADCRNSDFQDPTGLLQSAVLLCDLRVK